MYELSRVRLYSVGPAGARYEDVVLDLSGAGRPVRHYQPSLLGTSATPLRPSPATVLFLENGGGKSVLIKLIFSVVLPGRKQVVGTSDTRVLESFVQARDVAHVALEWTHSETGGLLITGKVSEWRGQSASADADNLVDHWYAFRPTPELNLDSLPVSEAGENLTVGTFRTRLYEADQRDRSIGLHWTKTQEKWTARLDELGLDGELFKYQRKMNMGEGEAVAAFNFSGDEGFVRFLLGAVLPDGHMRETLEGLEKYATTLADRTEMELERDFLDAMSGHLGPLADQARRIESAQARARDAERDVADLLQTLRRRATAEARRCEEAQERINTVNSHVEAGKKEVGTRRELVNALQYHALGLRHENAKGAVEASVERLTAAQASESAWRVVEAVLRARHATQARHDLEQVIAERTDAAKPALENRDRRALDLGRALTAIIADLMTKVTAAEEKATSAKNTAKELQDQHDQVVRNEGVARARAEQFTNRSADITSKIDRAVDQGLLPDPASLPQVCGEALTAVRSAEDFVESIEDSVLDLEESLELSRQEIAARKSAVQLAGQRHRAALTAVLEADAAARELADQPRVTELFDGAELSLESDVGVLIEALRTAWRGADTVRMALKVEETADERARSALDGGGLLPEPTDVIAVREALSAADIRCWTGWDYLSDIAVESTRSRLLRMAPHLLGGVVVNESDDLERAEDLLATADLRPMSTVIVSTTERLFVPDNTAAGWFATAHHPALHDEDAARAEQSRIQTRHQERQDRLVLLDAAIETDQSLEVALREWQRHNPPGTAAGRASVVESSKKELAAANSVLETEETRAGELTATWTGMREQLKPAKTALEKSRQRAKDLEELRQEAAKKQGLDRDAAAALEIAEAEKVRASALAEQANTSRDAAAAHQREADQYRAAGVRARDELRVIPLAEGTELDEPGTGEAVDVLRNRYTDAQRMYEKVEVGDDLRQDLARCHAEEKAATEALEREDRQAVEGAQALVVLPDAVDSVARAQALDRARQVVVGAEKEVSTARTSQAVCAAALEAAPKPVRQLSPKELAVDVDDADARVVAAERELDAASAGLAVLVAQVEREVQALAMAEKEEAAFRTLVASLKGGTNEDNALGGSVFVGTADHAAERYRDLSASFDDAASLLGRERETMQRTATMLVQLAVEPRFDALQAPIRTHVRAVPRDELVHHAAEWRAAVEPRLRSLRDELEQMEQHRVLIVEQLKAQVDNALRTLRAAQRLSRLPKGLGDWTGEEFLRIGFTPVEDAVVRDRLGALVDEVAHGNPLDAITLLVRGAVAATAKGFRVDMLKPDAVLKPERIRIVRVKVVFSGGQQLTAAIILYCTMAALRANDRGKVRNRHSGVLFLDNPIGRASASYLLELQLGVAESLGVQLVYTTGLFDAEALRFFPLIVRLRNDADLRAGRKYLSVESAVRPALEALPDPDDGGVLSAARVLRKPSR